MWTEKSTRFFWCYSALCILVFRIMPFSFSNRYHLIIAYFCHSQSFSSHSLSNLLPSHTQLYTISLRSLFAHLCFLLLPFLLPKFPSVCKHIHLVTCPRILNCTLFLVVHLLFVHLCFLLPFLLPKVSKCL